jgi:hypothetical protein
MGRGKRVEIKVYTDPPHQHLLSIAEKKFWRYVQGGEHPHLFGTEAAARSRQGCRNERVQLIGGASRHLFADPLGLSGSRNG